MKSLQQRGAFTQRGKASLTTNWNSLRVFLIFGIFTPVPPVPPVSASCPGNGFKTFHTSVLATFCSARINIQASSLIFLSSYFFLFPFLYFLICMLSITFPQQRSAQTKGHICLHFSLNSIYVNAKMSDSHSHDSWTRLWGGQRAESPGLFIKEAPSFNLFVYE